MNNLLLAIDGGGSKTEFSITDSSDVVLESIIIPESSNPWKNGDHEHAKSVINNGLSQLHMLDRVKACVAGISGCHGGNQFTSMFEDVIRSHLQPNTKIFVTGDILTSFRSQAPSTHGVLAISGSGSSISLLFPDGRSTAIPGVGLGGHDLGIILCMGSLRNEFTDVTKEWLKDIVGEPYDKFSVADLYLHSAITRIPEAISVCTNETIVQEVQPILDEAATRWAYKIWGNCKKYRTTCELADDHGVDLVLSGGMWRLDRLRNLTCEYILQADSNIIIHYDPETRSISGASKMAADLLNSD